MSTNLYGGALVGSVPPGWIDASDLRPVPDNQEVWMECADAERSLIIELMERPDIADAESVVLHFDELASGNDALRSSIVSSQQLPSKSERLGCDPPCFCACGSQTLAAGEGTECQLQVHLLVARLAEVKTDLLVSITRPVTKPITMAGKPIATEEETAADAALALSILDSIQIRDKGLFGVA
eukprot:CAMPEP_0119072600 /NCGR_PEP_ID=MMETSP1178-20130426/58470_1 /TAXON_ID=33656 /ORGANISM="unid sp, Strain CCMP2000" /LENGTH=182 /DNA_ID=CAMNT_0007054625 /DNA_START=20 /DNA_END=568 /DNA_ORIENTATION=-